MANFIDTFSICLISMVHMRVFVFRFYLKHFGIVWAFHDTMQSIDKRGMYNQNVVQLVFTRENGMVEHLLRRKINIERVR